MRIVVWGGFFFFLKYGINWATSFFQKKQKQKLINHSFRTLMA
jgi:arginine exporter protein ArgO